MCEMPGWSSTLLHLAQCVGSLYVWHVSVTHGLLREIHLFAFFCFVLLKECGNVDAGVTVICIRQK